MSDEFFMEVVLFLGWLVFNNYELGIYLDVFVNNMEFSKYMKVLFVDFDCNGKLFVFIVEGKDLLLYVIQWYLEKVFWEWNFLWKIVCFDLVIKFLNYFGCFFVNECKYNKNKFESLEVED